VTVSTAVSAKATGVPLARTGGIVTTVVRHSAGTVRGHCVDVNGVHRGVKVAAEVNCAVSVGRVRRTVVAVTGSTIRYVSRRGRIVESMGRRVLVTVAVIAAVRIMTARTTRRRTGYPLNSKVGIGDQPVINIIGVTYSRLHTTVIRNAVINVSIIVHRDKTVIVVRVPIVTRCVLDNVTYLARLVVSRCRQVRANVARAHSSYPTRCKITVTYRTPRIARSRAKRVGSAGPQPGPVTTVGVAKSSTAVVGGNSVRNVIDRDEGSSCREAESRR
jgi:hypothetical protein